MLPEVVHTLRSRYVVGDLQGCLPSLQELLRKLDFDAAQGDQLYVVGDLVNRGPQSLETLRFIRDMGPAAHVVLGNHDLALLAAIANPGGKRGARELAETLLAAPDGAQLIDWLRARPLMLVAAPFVMVHAGLLPQWTVAQAMSLASEVETVLRSAQWPEFMREMYGDEPAQWNDDLQGWGRLRIIVNAMTRLRFMTPDGALRMQAKGTPEDATPGVIPWHAAPDAAWRSHTVLCGHWSAQGYRDLGDVIALDSGCVWGGCLTALRLEDRKVFAVQCPEYADWRAGD